MEHTTWETEEREKEEPVNRGILRSLPFPPHSDDGGFVKYD